MRSSLFRHIHPSFIIVTFSAGIIAGVVLGFAFDLWMFCSPVWLAVTIILLIVNFCFSRAVFLCLALFAGIIIGAFRISIDIGDREYISQFVGQEIQVSGTIFEDPEVDGSTAALRIGNLVFGSSDHQKPVTGSLYIKLRDQENLERSARVTLTGKLSDGFGSFTGSMYRPKLIEISVPDPPDLALQFRNYFADLVKKFIPEPEVDLSLGYLLGQRRTLPADLLDTMKIVGLTHVIVASGYNLSILVRFSRRAFKRVSRFAALFSGMLLIISFTLVTGFSPSMARAGLVSSLSLLAWFFGRKFHPVKLLLFVASITLLLNPFYIQDLGWMLSFLSFIGVLIISPLLVAYFYGQKTKPNLLAGIAIETLSAQICCLPLLVFFFGTFSIVCVVANLLVLPTIPLTMLLTFFTGITSFLPFIATVFGWLSAKLLSFHIFVVDFFGNLNWAIIITSPGNLLALLSYLLIIASAIYMWRKTNFRLIEINVTE